MDHYRTCNDENMTPSSQLGLMTMPTAQTLIHRLNTEDEKKKRGSNRAFLFLFKCYAHVSIERHHLVFVAEVTATLNAAHQHSSSWY